MAALKNLLTVLAVLVLLPAALHGASPQVQPALDSTPREATAPKAALALSAGVDDDEFRSQLLLDLVEFHLQSGELEPALTAAQAIPGYRKGIALARVAAAQFRAGALDQAEPLIAEALAQSGFPHQWQREVIQAEVAIARAAAGDDAGARGLYDRLSDDSARYRAQAGIAVERVRRGGPIELESFAAHGNTSKLSPDLLHLVRGLLEIADQATERQKADREALKPLGEKIEEIIRTSRVTAGEELLDLGVLWRRAGETERSARILAEAIRHLAPGGDMQGWRHGYFAKLIRLYVDAGDTEKVPQLLKLARDGTARLHPFHQPPALCQLAEAELAAGMTAEAEATWKRAVTVALANPNPGSRFVGSTQVALSIARSGREIPTPVARLFESLIPPPQAESIRADQ